MKTVIIGGVAGGASAAARLRRLDESAQIIMLERGAYISYANCGLPYYIGGEITDKRELTLQTPRSFNRRFDIDVRVNSEAVSIDPVKKTVKVREVLTGNEYEESYDKLILSPGAEPVLPPIPGIRSGRIFTLRTIPDTYKISDYIKNEGPKTAIIVGGGFIGLEMAENLSHAGLSVTVVESADHLLGQLDYDMACEVHSYLRSKGLGLMLENQVKSFSDEGSFLSVEMANGERISADMAIISVGVRPETDLAKSAGITTNTRGAIITDEHMLTSDSNIYAVGDAVEVKNFITGLPAHIPLAGPANKQGRIAADNICGIKSSYKGSQGSSILKLFDMAVACTGLNEGAARAAGLDYDKIQTLSSSHASYYPGAENISIKTIFENGTGRILGAQLVGMKGIDKRCDVFATAIRANMTAFDLSELELSYAPPFSSAKDPVNMAGFAIENILTGKVKQFHWHDIPEVLADDGAILLDSRSDSERSAGYIPGSLHIPVDSLRQRIGELAPSKRIYVYCQSGLRSYIACRILSQNGFDCYNLSGGYRFYEMISCDRDFDAALVHPCGIKAGESSSV